MVASGLGSTNGGGNATISNASLTGTSVIVLTYIGNFTPSTPLTVFNQSAGTAHVKGDSSKSFFWVAF